MDPWEKVTVNYFGLFFFSLFLQPSDYFLKTNAEGKAVGLENILTFWFCLFVFTVMFMVSSLSNFLLVSPQLAKAKYLMPVHSPISN